MSEHRRNNGKNLQSTVEFVYHLQQLFSHPDFEKLSSQTPEIQEHTNKIKDFLKTMFVPDGLVKAVEKTKDEKSQSQYRT